MARNSGKELSPAIQVRKKILRVTSEGNIPLTPNRLPENPVDHREVYKKNKPFRVDRITALQEANELLSRMPYTKAVAIRRAIEELNRGQNEYVGIKDLVRAVARDVKTHNRKISQKNEGSHRQVTRTFDNMFDPNIGSAILPGNITLPDSSLGAYFTADRTFAPSHGGRELRGPNYFISFFPNLRLDERLNVMNKDVQEGLKVLGETNRGNLRNIRDYFLYTGVVDYLKIHSLTLFHAVTFNERFMKVPYGTDNPKKGFYERRRKEAFDLAKDSVRMYYQSLIGLPFDQTLDLSSMSKKFNRLANYVGEEFSRSVFNNQSVTGQDQLRYPEVNNPLVIGLGAHEAVRRYPNTDLIIGIPSGGTELAFCTQLLYELAGRNVDVLQIPISHRLYKNNDLFKRSFKKEHHQKISGKNILIEDDNSSTGQTLEYIGDALIDSAKSVAVHVAELDPRRLVIDARVKGHFNPVLSPTSTSIVRVESDPNGRFISIPAREIFKRMRSVRKA